ncbi:MAG: energy-coupling factor transporter transmembrane component T [candidate division Zixibacteria bacterium]
MKTGSVSRFFFAVSIAAAVLMANHVGIILAAIVSAVLALILWTRDLRNIFEPARLVIWFFAFLFILHLFSHPGKVLFSLFSLDATVEGAKAGLFYGEKLIVFVYSAFLILKTVEPFELVRPIERFSRISGKLGKPLSYAALSFSLALRFIPDLIRQGKMTMMVFNTRGIFFDGGLTKRLNGAVQLVSVVFVNALKSAESAALALAVKGYSNRFKRAVFPPARVSGGGILIALFSVVILVLGWRF